MTIKPTPRRRGSALAGAIVVIFMLLAVVMALHHYQGLARQTYMAAEADLRFREGTNFAVQKQLFPSSTTPSLSVTAGVTNVTPANVTSISAQAARNIFDRAAGLPDLRALENSPAHTYLKLTPTTSDTGLKVFGSRTYSAVLTQVPGFAVFAPKGSVNVTTLRGWSNPTFDDPRNTLQAYSGVPAVVAAAKDATVEQCTYGEAYAVNGTATIKAGQGVAYKTKEFPVRPYTDALLANIQTAKDKLTVAAATGDKTSSLVSDSVGPSAVLDLIFGGGEGLAQFLSLRNANHFWLPVIPAFLSNPPYLFEFSFSVPFPPDTADYSENPSAKAAKQDLENKQTEYGAQAKVVQQKSDAVKAAQKEYDENPSQANLNALNAAKSELSFEEGKLDDIKDDIEDLGKQLASFSEGGSNSIPPKVPPTRAEDPSGNDGQDGFCLSFVGDLLVTALKSIFTLDLDSFVNAFSNDDVKLVHFGSKNRAFGFQLEPGNMVLDATTTVPRGRTLKLRSTGTITIRGDLWLQRGSTFVAECEKLKLEDPPGGDSTSFYTPCGRIFLEEGATLVCTGQVEAPGSPESGSVIVGGVPGKIHPITTAIIADGGVKLPNGVFAASAIDDLVEGLSFGNPGLASLNNDLLRPLLSNIGPNAAKALGPFWARKPYFAKYCTTLWIIFPPVIFGAPAPVPVPVAPVPLPRENMLNPIAHALAYVYSTTLNMSLGENFYTHSDWWIFGEGVVPMIPQSNPVTLASSIANFPATALNALDPATLMANLVKEVAEQMIKKVLAKVIQKIATEVATAAIPYGGWAIMLANLAGVDDVITDGLGANENVGDSLISELGDTVKQAGANTLDSLKTKFTTLVTDKFLREYNGVLVSSGDTIEVGGKNATGMFIARQNVSMTAEQCVGTVISTEGNVNCRSLLYYPYFNRASLYVPKPTADGWAARAAEFGYDSACASGQATDVGPPAIPQRVAAQGWAK